MKCALFLLLLCPISAAAATFEDYERAREALGHGEILPLAEILDRVEAEFDGRMIEVEFEIEEGRYIYDLELITRDGRVLDVDVDAATGNILAVEDDD